MYDIITILGPTACGKTRLASQLAEKYNGAIISADSRQVYRGLTIGAGKDLSEYTVNDKAVPYYLIDIIPPVDEFDVFQFQKYFHLALDDIRSKKLIPFLTGGSGLYLSAVLENYQLEPVDFHEQQYQALQDLPLESLKERLIGLSGPLHNTTDLIERDRIIRAIIIQEKRRTTDNINPRTSSLTIGIRLPREEIKRRITERLRYRLENGMIEEAKQLLDGGLSHSKLQFFGLEYKYLSLYLLGGLSETEMFDTLNRAIHSFAKRQMTWFRRMEKHGVAIHWIDGPDLSQAENIIEEYYFADKK